MTAPDHRLIVGHAGRTVEVYTLDEKENARLTSSAPIRALDFCAAGKWLAFGDSAGMVHIIDVKLWREIGQYPHDQEVTSVAFDPTCDSLAVIGLKNAVMLVAGTWHPRTRIEHAEDIQSVAFGPGDGDLLTFTGRTIGLSKSRESVGRVLQHKGRVEPVASYSRESAYLRTITKAEFNRRDGLVQRAEAYFWEVPSGALVKTEEIDEDSNQEKPNWISIRPSKHPHAVSKKGPWPTRSTLQGVDLMQQQIAQSERAHGGSLLDESVSSDRRWLATVAEDGIVRLWPLTGEGISHHICSRLTRNLTEKEWLEFQLDGPRRRTCPDIP